MYQGKTHTHTHTGMPRTIMTETQGNKGKLCYLSHSIRCQEMKSATATANYTHPEVCHADSPGVDFVEGTLVGRCFLTRSHQVRPVFLFKII